MGVEPEHATLISAASRSSRVAVSVLSSRYFTMTGA